MRNSPHAQRSKYYEYGLQFHTRNNPSPAVVSNQLSGIKEDALKV